MTEVEADSILRAAPSSALGSSVCLAHLGSEVSDLSAPLSAPSRIRQGGPGAGVLPMRGHVSADEKNSSG